MKVLKPIVLLFTISSILAGIHCVQVNAKGEVEFTVEVDEKNSPEIKAEVKLDNNSDVAGFDISIIYDSNQLEYKGAEKGSAANKDGFYDINYLNDKPVVRAVYGSLTGMKKKGTILKMVFQKKDEFNGQIPIYLQVNSIVDDSAEINELPYNIKGNNDATGEKMAEFKETANGTIVIEGEGYNEAENTDSVQKQKEEEKEDVNEKNKEIKVKEGEAINKNLEEPRKDNQIGNNIANKRKQWVVVIAIVLLVVIIAGLVIKRKIGRNKVCK